MQTVIKFGTKKVDLSVQVLVYLITLLKLIVYISSNSVAEFHAFGL